MLKPAPMADHRLLQLAVLALATGTLCSHSAAQSAATGPQNNNKRVATIRFGTNGSDPEGTRDPKERILQGRVQDTNGKPVRGAVVYLKDKQSDSVRELIVDDHGGYRFVQLAQNKDYEVWAQLDKKKGALKQISSFDDRTDIMLNLKVE